MRKILLSGLAAAALVLGTPMIAKAWTAVAANSAGYGTGSGSTEEGARSAAIRNCQESTGSTCSQSTSVPDSWYVVAVRCNGRAATAGSSGSVRDAIVLAERKIPGCSRGEGELLASR